MVNGDKEAVDAHAARSRIMAVGFVGSTPIAQYIYATATANGKRAQCFGGAKNHAIVMPDADLDDVADQLIGAGYGAAGERCMAISVAVPVGEETADELVEKLTERVHKLNVGPSDQTGVDFGPLVTSDALRRVEHYVQIGIDEGAEAVVDGRGYAVAGAEDGFFTGATLFDKVTKEMRIYQEEIFGPVLQVVRAHDYEEALSLPTRSRVRQRRRHLHPRRRYRSRLRGPRAGRYGRHQCSDPGADRLPHVRRLEALRLRRPEPARPRLHPLLHQDQDGDAAVAEGIEGNRGEPRDRSLRYSHDELTAHPNIPTVGSCSTPFDVDGTPQMIHGECDFQFLRVRDEFDRNFAERGELGASVCVVVDGAPVVDLWGGVADPHTGREWDRDTLNVVMSCSKGLTATCVNMLVDRGQIDLDTPVVPVLARVRPEGKVRHHGAAGPHSSIGRRTCRGDHSVRRTV